MSCLPSDALSHFEQRERELLALNQDLDQRKETVLKEASNAVQQAHEPVEERPLSSAWRPPKPAAAPSEDRPAKGAPPSEDAPATAPAAAPVADPVRVPSPAAPAAPSGPHTAGKGDEALHTTIRFQNARIMQLQEELDRTITELQGRDREVKQQKEEISKMSQMCEELKRLQKIGQEVERLRKSAVTAEDRVKELEAERAEMLKDKNQVDVQARRVEAENSTKEARLNRLTEENERLKASLKEMSNQDKDRSASDRRETDRLTSEIRKLERQRSELVNAFKKQMKLIEVLKRQRAHMEAARVLNFTEEEFIRILELGDKLGEPPAA